MRSADMTAAGTWGGSTLISEDDEAYPSDGIIQVEEEEEQVNMLPHHYGTTHPHEWIQVF